MTRPPAEITEALRDAGSDAHSGWYLYDHHRFGKSKHSKDWGDCTVEACSWYLKVSGLAAAPAPASPAVRDDLCPDCGHHLHRPNPGQCQWRDCQCGSGPAPLHVHFVNGGDSYDCDEDHAPAPASPDEPLLDLRDTVSGGIDGDPYLNQHDNKAAHEALDAIVARAASASVPPLDVERLRHAIEQAGFYDPRLHPHYAEAVSAAYAAETPEQDR